MMVFCNRLVSECFRSKHMITFENMYLRSCWFHCVDISFIKFLFHINLKLLSVDLLHNYTCMFLVNINSNVLDISPSLFAFHIPFIFALEQLKISEICMLLQPIKLQIFCILTIKYHIRKTFMEKICRRCTPKTTSRPLPNFGK